MRRGVCAALAALAVSAAIAVAADGRTVIGEVTTAWHAKYTLSVVDETRTTPGGGREPQRCLELAGPSGDAAWCPPELRGQAVAVAGGVGCIGRTPTIELYGVLDPRAASVRLRLGGGRSVPAARFDPRPDIDPGIAYWVALARGKTRVLGLTALAADGSVLQRIVNPVGDENEACGDREFHGRRFLVGRGRIPSLGRWSVHAYRRDVREQGEPTHKDVLCLASHVRETIDRSSSAGESCQERLSRDVKAFTIGADSEGCRSKAALFVRGLARPRVARMVLRAGRQTTVVPLVRAPAWLHLRARLYAGAATVGTGSSVLIAEDRSGRELAHYRIGRIGKPIRVGGQTLCGSGFLGGEARSGS